MARPCAVTTSTCEADGHGAECCARIDQSGAIFDAYWLPRRPTNRFCLSRNNRIIARLESGLPLGAQEMIDVAPQKVVCSVSAKVANFLPYGPTTKIRGWRPAVALTGAIALILGVASASAADQISFTTVAPAASGQSARLHFNIQSAPLPTALDDFSAASGIQVLYDGALANGRVSATVRGVMTADAALAQLLQGTGLSATFTRDRNVIIVLSPDSVKVLYAPAPVTTATELGEIHVDVPRNSTSGGMYATLVQYQLQRALRKKPELLVGNYQAQVRIWVDAAGVVQRSQMVASNANTRFEEALLAALKNMVVGEPPPADLLQPVSIRVAVSGR